MIVFLLIFVLFSNISQATELICKGEQTISYSDLPVPVETKLIALSVTFSSQSKSVSRMYSSDLDIRNCFDENGMKDIHACKCKVSDEQILCTRFDENHDYFSSVKINRKTAIAYTTKKIKNIMGKIEGHIWYTSELDCKAFDKNQF